MIECLGRCKLPGRTLVHTCYLGGPVVMGRRQRRRRIVVTVVVLVVIGVMLVVEG